MAKGLLTEEVTKKYMSEVLEQMASDFESVGGSEEEVREAMVTALWQGLVKMDNNFVWSIYKLATLAWTNNLFGKMDKRNTVLFIMMEKLAKLLRDDNM